MAKLKLTEEMIEKAAKLIAAGNYHKTVAQYLGIHEATWWRWLQKGETAKSKRSIYRKLYEAVKKAEAEAQIRNVAIIQKAAQETWQAAAWWLERRYPELWGRKDTVRLGTEDEDGLKLRIEVVDAGIPPAEEDEGEVSDGGG